MKKKVKTSIGALKNVIFSPAVMADSGDTKPPRAGNDLGKLLTSSSKEFLMELFQKL